MAGPITWRNVNSRSISDAARLLENSQDSINSGFDAFTGVIADARKTSDDNYKQRKVNNTDAFRNELAKYSTPEALEAAKADGSLNAFVAKLGSNIDQDVIRTGFDDRLAQVRDDVKAGFEYDDAVLAEEADPVAEQIAGLFQTNRIDEGNALLDQNQELMARSGNEARLRGLSETLSNQYEDRGELERNRAMATDSDALVTTIASSAPNEETAVAQYMEQAFRNNITGSTYDQGLAAVRNRFQEINELGTRQKEELEQVRANASNARAATISAQETAYAEIARVNQPNERYSFTDNDKVALGDVVARAEELGYDKNSWFGDNVRDGINNTYNDVVNTYKIEDPHEKDVAKIILKRAVEALGSESNTFTIQNLPKTALKDRFDEMWGEYVRSLDAEENLLAAKQSLDATISQAIQEETNTVNARLNQFRQDNANIRNLQRGR